VNQLRILVCALACDPKGASGLGTGEDLLGWNIVKQISRFHDAWIITSPQNKSGIESIVNQGSLNNAHFSYVELPNWLRCPLQHFWSQGGSQIYTYLWQLKAYLSARQLHKEIQFQVFHHVTYANDWMASFNGALLPVSYIRGPGGGAHRVPKGFLSMYSLPGRLWEYFRVVGQWLFRRDPFFIKGQKRARAILLCNQESVNALQHSGPNNLYLFPVNGINASDLKPYVQSQNGNKTNTFRILSAGRLARFKGFPLAIRAFQMFITNYPEAEFQILGDGPDRPYLEDLIHSLGLYNKLHLSSWVTRDELLDEMRESDVFLFPSFRDGGGAVVVEAMASGLPVICMDTGGPGFHIQDEWGIKIKPKTPEYVVSEMAKALEGLYLDRDLRERLGRAARRRAEEFYLWDRLGERLMKIYEEAIRNDRPSGR
jgi:glycosyltransferase involved in cell wall biosynthesis